MIKKDNIQQDKYEVSEHEWNNVHENVHTSFNEIVVMPEIESEASIHLQLE
jgi:hypothetical protein